MLKDSGLASHELAGPKYMGALVCISTDMFTWNEYFIMYPPRKVDGASGDCPLRQAELRKLDMTLAELGFTTGNHLMFSCGTR